MRLRSIRLRNFGYYGQETIDLSRIAACTVIGQNGTGKSTGLVDAPLWAFFEQCRGKADEMIKPGELDMSVEVVWEQDGRTYQVIRKRSKRTKAGKSELALHVKQAEDWQSISGASIAATQEKLEKLLGLDYDLLTKTAFLLQGQADAFSKAKPNERKAILASILRLDRYAALKSLANSEANKLRAKQESLGRELATVDAVVNTISTLQHELAMLLSDIAQQERQVADLSAQRDALIARKASLAAQHVQAEADRRLVADLQKRTAELSARIAELEATRERHEAVLAGAPEVRAAVEDMEHSRVRLEEMDREIRSEIEPRLSVLTETIASVRVRIADLQAARERAQAVLSNAASIRAASVVVDQSRQQSEDIDREIQTQIEPSLSSLTDKIAAVEADRRALQTTQLAYQSAKQDLDLLIQGYQAETKRLAQDLERDQTTVKLLERVPCGTDLQKRCQFTISAAKIQEALPEKVRAFADRPQEPSAIGLTAAAPLAAEVTRLDAERRAKESTVDQVAYQAMLDERTQLTARRDTLRSQLLVLRQAIERAKLLSARLPEVEMAEQTLAEAERRAHDANVDEPTYQAMLHDHAQLTARRDTLRSQQTLLQQDIDAAQALASRLPAVEVAEHALPGIDADLTAKHTEMDAAMGDLLAANDRVRAADAVTVSLAQVEQDLRALSIVDRAVHTDLQAKLVSQGLCQEKLNAAEAAKHSAAAIRSALSDVDTDCRHYGALADAYGLIPVLVMESSIPILEREANEMLSKISSTGLRVRFETQKALASRDGLAETLDIIASDAKCERRYELYSGGEKFRLDLAIRIGLSKLLANRAGAKLETLVIDEGLGSLDQDGLTQLRECLSALGSEFKCVIVITHVEAMKSTFPSQIFVSADADGSHVKVFA